MPKNDKANSFIVILLFLATCGVAFGLPFMLSGVTAAERRQAKLIIPNTGGDYITATRSTERVLTIEAFATLFFSPTPSLTATFTSFPTATLSFTPTSINFTHTSTSLPTLTATIPVVTVQPSFTSTPTKISQPGKSPTAVATSTSVSTPVPTKIMTATASKTPVPSVTYTLIPTLTFTPKPPTPTNTEPPTNTPETPTDIPVETPTDIPTVP